MPEARSAGRGSGNPVAKGEAGPCFLRRRPSSFPPGNHQKRRASLCRRPESRGGPSRAPAVPGEAGGQSLGLGDVFTCQKHPKPTLSRPARRLTPIHTTHPGKTRPPGAAAHLAGKIFTEGAHQRLTVREGGRTPPPAHGQGPSLPARKILPLDGRLPQQFPAQPSPAKFEKSGERCAPGQIPPWRREVLPVSPYWRNRFSTAQF